MSKTLTAGMDGDAIGGTVNFNLKEAPDRLCLELIFKAGTNSDFNHWGKTGNTLLFCLANVSSTASSVYC